MYCGKCGSDLESDFRYCGSCGASVSSSGSDMPPVAREGGAISESPPIASRKPMSEKAHDSSRKRASRWPMAALITAGGFALIGVVSLLALAVWIGAGDDKVGSGDAKPEASLPTSNDVGTEGSVSEATVAVGDFSEGGMLGMPWGTSPDEALPVFVSRLGGWVSATAPPCISPGVNQEQYSWSYVNSGPRTGIRATFVEGELAAWEVNGFGWDGETPSPIWPGMKLTDMRLIARTSLVGPNLQDEFQFGPVDAFPYSDAVVQGTVGPPYGATAGEYEVTMVRVYGAFDPAVDERCLPEM